MTPIVEELLRLRTDRGARLGVSIGLAVLYLLLVIAQDLGPSTVLLAALLAPSIVLWRRLPAVAVLLAAVACVELPVSQLSTVWGVFSLGPALLVVLPVLGAALDERAWVRWLGTGLAVLFPVCVALWGALAGGIAFGATLSATVIAAVPVAAAAAWRRPAIRRAATDYLHRTAPSIDRDSSRFRLAVGVAIVAYLLAALLGVGERDLRPLLTALPAAASIVWFRSRTDLALVLSGSALLLVLVLGPIDSSFRTGLTLTCLYALVPVFGAATSGVRSLRIAGAVVVLAFALLCTIVTGSLYGAFVAIVLGGLAYGFDLLAHQTRSARRLRRRLRETEEHVEVAERDVRVEQERNRIARDVHDVVAHSLAVVIAQADGARFAAETSPTSVLPALEAIGDTARAALGEVRTMLHDLKHDGGTTVAAGASDVPALVDGVRALGIDVEEAVYGEPGELAPEGDLALYRIVQEALTNALRHGSREAAVRLEVDWGERSVVIAVSNRVDVAAPAATERRGHGIDGMRERAELVGGECTAGPGSDGTFRVRVVLPVGRPAAPVAQVAEPDEEPRSLIRLLGFEAPSGA